MSTVYVFGDDYEQMIGIIRSLSRIQLGSRPKSELADMLVTLAEDSRLLLQRIDNQVHHAEESNLPSSAD